MNGRPKDLHGAKSTIRMLEGLAETVLLAVLYYLFWRNGYDEGIFPAYYGMGKYVLSGVYALLIVILFFNFEGFKFGYLKTTDAIISQWIALLIANFITYWQLCLIANVVITPVPMIALMIVDMVVSLICTYCFSLLYHHLYIPKNMVMIYGSRSALVLKLKMDSRYDKYRITKLIPATEAPERIFEQLPNYDAVIINDVSAQLRNDILKYCYKNQIRTYVAPKISDIILGGAMDITLFDTPLLLVKGRGLTPIQKFWKRAMDITICLIAMIVAAPIMLLVAIAIKLEDGGPVFYKQKRVKFGNEEFEMIKFRSMIPNAEEKTGAVLARGDDERITKVGKVIRATRLDEIPQILNILKGDMSIVGPRPERKVFIEEYCKDIPEFAYRTKVKAGLTGYAQIYGKYNTSPYDKLRLDLMYIENYSLMLDIKLILMTMRVMLNKDSTEGFDKLLQMQEETSRLAADGDETKV